MPLLETPEGQIETHEWGSGNDLIVLLHASATGPQTLTRLAQELSTPNRRIVAPALSGYGQTRLTNQTSPIDANLQITRHILNNHGGSSRIVLGHSMGGLIALLTAMHANKDDAPLDALILYEPILPSLLDLSTTDEAAAVAWDRSIIASLREAVDEGDREAGVRGFIEAWNEVNWADLPEPVRRHLLGNAENLVHETAATSKHVVDQKALQALHLPTLLLQGATSPGMTHLTTQKAADLIPNACHVTMPATGHMAPISSPDRVAAELRRFLEDL